MFALILAPSIDIVTLKVSPVRSKFQSDSARIRRTRHRSYPVEGSDGRRYAAKKGAYRLACETIVNISYAIPNTFLLCPVTDIDRDRDRSNRRASREPLSFCACSSLCKVADGPERPIARSHRHAVSYTSHAADPKYPLSARRAHCKRAPQRD
jgi:hypothetical protein